MFCISRLRGRRSAGIRKGRQGNSCSADLSGAATLEQDISTPDAAATFFEDTVRLSPYDYRWWIDLGHSLEQAEKLDRAESAFKRSVELAPYYAFPHWQLGNFYLRQKRGDEAFA